MDQPLTGQELLDFVSSNRTQCTEKELALKAGYCTWNKKLSRYVPHPQAMLKALLAAKGVEVFQPKQKAERKLDGIVKLTNRGQLYLGREHARAINAEGAVELEYVPPGEEVIVPGPAWVLMAPAVEVEPEPEKGAPNTDPTLPALPTAAP
jgi:hypothetical protein